MNYWCDNFKLALVTRKIKIFFHIWGWKRVSFQMKFWILDQCGGRGWGGSVKKLRIWFQNGLGAWGMKKPEKYRIFGKNGEELAWQEKKWLLESRFRELKILPLHSATVAVYMLSNITF